MKISLLRISSFSKQQQTVHFSHQAVYPALMKIALLSFATIFGVVGSSVTYAQVPASPSYVSPLVTPLAVQVTPSPPVLESAIPSSTTPMITVPEGEPLPTQPPPSRIPIPARVIQTEAPGVAEAAIEAIGLISDPIVNVAGLTSAANPPDTVGDVRSDHVVQTVQA